MRWLQLVALVLSLLLTLAISFLSHGLAREIGRKHHEGWSGRKSPWPSPPPAAAVGLLQCNSRKQLGSCGSEKMAEKDDGSIVEDDKRVVPTGPNPLHNR
ncbi:hypothetical protein Taro_037433 [Colocasia esculenta]|uniref:Uncharacterized protein n=1 Tax=Colocasia esculenta TaxID=4460 RepID=A0A843WB32_COLES|nr:hypothetical protein [Colocasia esculenta]